MQFTKNLIILFVASLFLFACGGKTDKELYTETQDLLKQEKFSDGLTNLETLLKEYPESEYAATAKIEIGQLYHSKVIKNLSAQESFLKAIEYYTLAAKDHPKSDRAPNALFMVAYIYANELSDVTKAEESYKYFISTYPENELVASAKEELKNLGLKPEEILKKKMDKTN